jgi:hypothetical protein
MIDSLTFL